VRKHAAVLRAEGLIAERPAHAMRAADGTVLEVFEWRSPAAIDEAHGNVAVRALWAEFEQCCDYVSLGGLAEAQQPFAEFDALPP